jgi:hypothetical protein
LPQIRRIQNVAPGKQASVTNPDLKNLSDIQAGQRSPAVLAAISADRA